jgi:hypothetical protein
MSNRQERGERSFSGPEMHCDRKHPLCRTASPGRFRPETTQTQCLQLIKRGNFVTYATCSDPNWTLSG